MTEARNASRLLSELGPLSEGVVPSPVQRQLFESFEEIGRRRKIDVPPQLRPIIYRLLAMEVAVNADLFEDSTENVAAATLYNGVLDGLIKDFPEFQETPGIFRQAVSHYPSDPFGFLHKVRRSIETLERDERFAEFRDEHGLFVLAATIYLNNPAGFLLKVQQSVRDLQQDERFAEFRDTPFVFRRAAISHPDDPSGFLLQVQESVHDLERDDRFIELRKTPGVFLVAATKHPRDPGAFLAKELARKQSKFQSPGNGSLDR